MEELKAETGLAHKFLTGSIKSTDVYMTHQELAANAGDIIGFGQILNMIGLNVFAERKGCWDNNSDGHRHAVFDVGIGEWATHKVDIQWNSYYSTKECVKVLCGESVCYNPYVDIIKRPYKIIYKNDDERDSMIDDEFMAYDWASQKRADHMAMMRQSAESLLRWIDDQSLRVESKSQSSMCPWKLIGKDEDPPWNMFCQYYRIFDKTKETT